MKKALYSVKVINATANLYNSNDLNDALNMRVRWASQLGKGFTVIVIDNETGEIVAGV